MLHPLGLHLYCSMVLKGTGNMQNCIYQHHTMSCAAHEKLGYGRNVELDTWEARVVQKFSPNVQA